MHLFTAGPAQTPPPILQTLSSPTLHHRSDAFAALLSSCKQGLQGFVDLPHLFFTCSSGSGGMESAISSFAPRKILVLNHGKFSRRWLEIAYSFGISTYDFHLHPAFAHETSEVVKILERDREIDCVCLQSCESSSGVSQNLSAIARAIKANNSKILVCVDAIASFGGERLETRDIDILIASSQKVLMLPVGLSFIFLSDYARDILPSRKPRSFYLALQNYLKNPIAFSMPSQLFLALQNSLSLLEPSANFALIEERFLLLKAILESKGTRLFASQPSPIIIAFEDENEAIRTALKTQNILISGGQDELKGKISRIGNFGILQEISPLIQALQKL